MLPLSGKGKNTCWKIFFKYAHFLTGVERNENVDNAWAFACSLHGIGEKDVSRIYDTRHSLIVKGKRDLDVLLSS